MRRAAKVDANQPLIVEAFESYGCSVCHLHGVGKGCPDLLVAHRNWPLPGNLLVEVKDGEKPPSARKLTLPQEHFHQTWRGRIEIVESVDDVQRIMETSNG